jgi:hypothetical protein
LHNNVSVLNTKVQYTQKQLRWYIYVTCALPQFFKVLGTGRPSNRKTEIFKYFDSKFIEGN